MVEIRKRFADGKAFVPPKRIVNLCALSVNYRLGEREIAFVSLLLYRRQCGL